LMATGLFGLSASLRFASASPAISYVAQASFWIYLLHHPVVGLMHVDLAMASLSPEVEVFLTSVVSLAFCLLTYEAFVRRTWIGQLLNGRRLQRAPVGVGESTDDS